MLLCYFAKQKRIMDKRLAIFVFLLCLVSASTVGLYTKISSTTYRPMNYSVLSCLQ